MTQHFLAGIDLYSNSAKTWSLIWISCSFSARTLRVVPGTGAIGWRSTGSVCWWRRRGFYPTSVDRHPADRLHLGSQSAPWAQWLQHEQLSFFKGHPGEDWVQVWRTPRRILCQRSSKMPSIGMKSCFVVWVFDIVFPALFQVYHQCLFGIRYDFLCANFTAFDQKNFICHFANEVDCDNSHLFFDKYVGRYLLVDDPTKFQLKFAGMKHCTRRPRPHRHPPPHRLSFEAGSLKVVVGDRWEADAVVLSVPSSMTTTTTMITRSTMTCRATKTRWRRRQHRRRNTLPPKVTAPRQNRKIRSRWLPHLVTTRPKAESFGGLWRLKVDWKATGSRKRERNAAW